MGKILYEASFKMEFSYLIPIIMLFLIPVFPFMFKKAYQNRKTIISIKFVNVFCLFGEIYVFILFSILILIQIDLYKKTVGAYKSGEYQIVEGYVENFDPMPYQGHSNESFDIVPLSSKD